jgi:hypothetical protein
MPNPLLKMAFHLKTDRSLLFDFNNKDGVYPRDLAAMAWSSPLIRCFSSGKGAPFFVP